MTNKLGIIPAAGAGKRWGYYPKFLLPCGERQWLLDRSINAMPCEKVVVVYGEDTEDEIRNHVKRCGLQDRVILKPNLHMELDFYGSMLAGLEESADYYYFAMPDTFWPVETFEQMFPPGITLGVHYTETPERYGVIRDGIVINKQLGQPGMAWGLLGWSREVRNLWISSVLETYTDAINLAMQECHTEIVAMEYYYDMASFFDYARFIKAIT